MVRNRILLIALALVLLLSCVSCAKGEENGLFVEVLDVGQSDCTLIRQGDAVLMIDCGTLDARNAVQFELDRRDIKRIDVLLLTHMHEDHVGNARMLLETYTVGALILPVAMENTLDERLILQAAERNGVPTHTASAGDTFSVGGATLDVLYVANEADDLNDTSVVSRLTFGEMKFLFTGDGEAAVERALLSLETDLDCDFLKAGHHGSKTSSSAELLAAVTPQHVAISCGKDNDYGFPHRELLERLGEVGATWHRTDEEGTLIYYSDGVSIFFMGED